MFDSGDHFASGVNGYPRLSGWESSPEQLAEKLLLRHRGGPAVYAFRLMNDESQRQRLVWHCHLAQQAQGTRQAEDASNKGDGVPVEVARLKRALTVLTPIAKGWTSPAQMPWPRQVRDEPT
ncbi:MAG: hypothetical protein ACKVPX_14920 [Myxococcaceae bacterium]